MEEVENKSEITEEVVPSPMDTAQEQPPQAETQEDRHERNWKKLSESKEEWKKRAKALEDDARMQRELNQQLMQRVMQPQAAPQEPEEDIIGDLLKEEYVSGEKVAKGLKKIEKKFERQIAEMDKRYEDQKRNSLFQSVKVQYPDFDQVVNPEAIARLEETKPTLAKMIAETNDPYRMAVQSYEYIKALGLNSSDDRRSNEVEKKIEQNKKTVQSPQAFDKRPMAQAFKLTEENKKELQEEMMRYAGQAGFGY